MGHAWALDGNKLIQLAGVKGSLDEIGAVGGTAIVHLTGGHYVALTDCDSAFVTLLGSGGRGARFPKDALESGISGILFVSPDLLKEVGVEGVPAGQSPGWRADAPR